MVVKVIILASNYGDKNQTMTVQQLKDMYNTNPAIARRQWAIFAEDTANPETNQRLDSIDQVKDGQTVTLVPQLAGG